MPEIDDSEIDEDTLPTRGRRAAPKSGFAAVSAALLDPIAPLVARIAAWVAAHRLGVLLTVAVVVAVTAIGSGAALMRTVTETAFGEDAETSTREHRPTPESTDAEGIGPHGPILPTSTPAPPFRIPEPTEAPSEAPEPTTVPVPEPTAEPEPSDTPEPTTDRPGNGNGKGKGTPGGPDKPD
jgi:outer membrane biosynthesis protein TonB